MYYIIYRHYIDHRPPYSQTTPLATEKPILACEWEGSQTRQ